MKQIIKKVLLTLVISLFVIFFAHQTLAATVFDKAKTNLGNTELTLGKTVTTQTLPERIGYFLNVAYSALGLIAIIIIIWGGFKWIVSGGDSKKIGEAKEQILYAIVGLAVVVLAFSLTSYVIDKLYGLAV